MKDARREAGQHRLRLLFCCEAGQLLAVVSSRPVPAGSSAAVLQGLCRSDRPPAVFACSGPCSAGFVCLLLPLPCHAHCPCSLAPFILLCPPPCSFHVRQDRRASCTNCPLAATTRACSGGPCAGSPFDSDFFFLQIPLILGHGLV